MKVYTLYRCETYMIDENYVCLQMETQAIKCIFSFVRQLNNTPQYLLMYSSLNAFLMFIKISFLTCSFMWFDVSGGNMHDCDDNNEIFEDWVVHR